MVHSSKIINMIVSTTTILLGLFLVSAVDSACECQSEASNSSLNNSTLDDDWSLFKLVFGKKYATSEEEQKRKEIFIENKKWVGKRNYEHKRRRVAYTVGTNYFSDMNISEIKEMISCKIYENETNPSNLNIVSFDAPELGNDAHVKQVQNMNWTRLGGVTAIKDQKLCPACYAFAVTAAVEGRFFRNNKHLVSLSEQNLIDCSSSFGNKGCHGGSIVGSLEYIKNAGGINKEFYYPYSGIENGKCQHDPHNIGAKVHKIAYVPKRKEGQLKKAVMAGPVVALINADPRTFIFYKSGVYGDRKCGQAPTHAVAVVGFGYDKQTKANFWILKNSWGPKWGEKGFMRMRRGKNVCGIADKVFVPIVEKV